MTHRPQQKEKWNEVTNTAVYVCSMSFTTQIHAFFFPSPSQFSRYMSMSGNGLSLSLSLSLTHSLTHCYLCCCCCCCCCFISLFPETSKVIFSGLLHLALHLIHSLKTHTHLFARPHFGGPQSDPTFGNNTGWFCSAVWCKIFFINQSR